MTDRELLRIGSSGKNSNQFVFRGINDTDSISRFVWRRKVRFVHIWTAKRRATQGDVNESPVRALLDSPGTLSTGIRPITRSFPESMTVTSPEASLVTYTRGAVLAGVSVLLLQASRLNKTKATPPFCKQMVSVFSLYIVRMDAIPGCRQPYP